MSWSHTVECSLVETMYLIHIISLESISGITYHSKVIVIIATVLTAVLQLALLTPSSNSKSNKQVIKKSNHLFLSKRQLKLQLLYNFFSTLYVIFFSFRYTNVFWTIIIISTFNCCVAHPKSSGWLISPLP